MFYYLLADAEKFLPSQPPPQGLHKQAHPESASGDRIKIEEISDIAQKVDLKEHAIFGWGTDNLPRSTVILMRNVHLLDE